MGTMDYSITPRPVGKINKSGGKAPRGCGVRRETPLGEGSGEGVVPSPEKNF